jgi:hypothetical protein
MSNGTIKHTEQSTTKVEHNYRDFSQMTAIEETANQIGSGEQLPKAVRSHFSDRSFPVKLHYMLSELEADGMSHIVSWQPHGRSFLVHKRQKFVEKILPL